MSAKTQTRSSPPPTSAAGRRVPNHPTYSSDGLSPKKSALIIIVTVIGCIAILWPKVFYPMMFGTGTEGAGATNAKPSNVKELQRGPGSCCDVVLDREQFLNATPAAMGPNMYRKQLNLLTGEMSLRQERPAHLHPESIYQAMRERGRAIPATPTVPIVERKGSATNPPPRIVEGRPGPIPGMRPPMGAGSVHQPQAKGTSMGFIMPLYTIGIIVFFGYTIMKLVFKKPVPNAPYGPAPTDPNFRKDVFGQENGRHVEELNGTKLGWREHQTRTNQHARETPRGGGANELYNASLSAATIATNLSSSLKQHQQQHRQHAQPPAESEKLMEIEKLRKKLEDTERAMAKLIAEMNSDQYDAKKPNENSTTNNADISNGHKSSPTNEQADGIANSDDKLPVVDSHVKERKFEDNKNVLHQRKRRDGSADRSVTVLGMEVTASCEGGQKWTGRPPTPVFFSHNEHSKDDDEDMPEPQSIYLEGSLAHESQILVADSETKTEEVYESDFNGSYEEPAVVLSSKMTLSLINLDSNEQNETGNNKADAESPLADDIEIIGHEDN